MNKSSLRFRLITILSIASLVLWGIATTIAWFYARKNVNEVFDAQQILFAQKLASSDMSSLLIERNLRGGFRPHRKHHRKIVGEKIDDDALAFAIFTSQGDIILSDGREGENFIYSPKRGFSEAKIYGDDDRWRIFWLPTYDEQFMVAVGQEIDYRRDMVNDMIFGQMWVWLLGFPFLLAIIYVVVRQEMRRFNQVNADLKNRLPEDHHLICTEGLPSEALPLVNNLNNFFQRTAQTLLRERRFTSDAAHELRSPLAALRIQTELAQMAGEDSKMRDAALANLMQGIDRTSQLIEQLLTLSRLDSLVEMTDLETIHWADIVVSLIVERYFFAQKSHIDLQFEQNATPTLTLGQPLLISLMLCNLLDNAIKYCPEGTIVKVILEAEQIVIEDNGGGVDDKELAKLGQRFYRPAGQNEKGSGLGLSIVYRIAQLHHYQVRLENIKNSAGDRKGLRVIILF